MIVRHIRRWIDAGEQTLMVQLAGAPEKIDARHLEMAARAGDAMALRALDQMALYLGVWVFNLYITLNINCFVFGGGLVNMGELLFGRVRQVFDSYCHTEEPWSFSSPSAARRRAFWARWSCCSNIGKCARGGEKFCQLLKKLRGVGAATSRWDVASGRPSRQARLAPHGLPTGAAGEKSSGPAARREADRPSRKPFAQDRKRTSKEKLGCPFYLLVGESRSEPYRPFGARAVFAPGPFSPAAPPARSRDSVSRSASFLLRKLGKELPPPPARFFYYLHSLYTFAPWVGNAAASFSSTNPWSWWLHSSRAV